MSKDAEGQDCWCLLRSGLNQLGFDPELRQLQQFSRYAEMLQEWNQRINLTAITGCEGIVIKHFLDSLLFWQEINTGSGRICDVGSGAGFPGLPFKIMFPSLEVVLLESTGKKVIFLNAVIFDLGLKGITAVKARAEDYGRIAGIRETFDVVMTRALAALPVAGELCLPLVKIGGYMAGLIGPNEEFSVSRVISRLGGGDFQVFNKNLPFLQDPRVCFLVKKLSPTPSAYPRRSGIPEKRPLKV
jgi:16S rRNA (guanine527-N7)-methyltransferase